MKIVAPLSIALILLFASAGISTSIAQNLSKAAFVSLRAEVLSKGNRVEADGNLHEINTPLLRLMRSDIESPKGTALILAGGGYEILKMKNEGEKMAIFLNSEGFDVVVLEYRVSKVQNPDLALDDALRAFRLLKTNGNEFGLEGKRLVIVGISSGGHLAARLVQKLGKNEQPDDLILISPTNLNETPVNSVFSIVRPPVQPTAGLFVSFSAKDNKDWIYSAEEYAKTWKGYDGRATFQLLPDNSTAQGEAKPADKQPKLPDILKEYLSTQADKPANTPNPAAIPVQGYAKQRYAAKLDLVAKEKFELILIGNSITHNFEKPQYQAIWKQFFAPRKALNLGTSAYRTENILWDLQNGILDGQSPKVVVLEVGTNNVDEKNYPTRHTAGQLAGGIEAIIKTLRAKLPDTKIIVLRCFPGCYGGPNPGSHRAILERASDRVSKLADGKHIFYWDVNHVFLNLDGSINREAMPDWLHPSPAAAKAWAQAMEPLLSELMGDKSRDTEIPENSAIVPRPNLENNSYDWLGRHKEILCIKDSIDPEIVLIGNSITHLWGGEPPMRWADGTLREHNGPESWDALFRNYRVLNLGFGWDRTQNVLWRLDRGELDGLQPRTVIILIGTNNTGQSQHARKNTASEIVEGIQAICLRVRSKVPHAKIVLMAVFPREQKKDHPLRIFINEINEQLETFAKEQKITFVNIGSKMLDTDGSFLPGLTSDFCHPTEKGYQLWADELRPIISEP
ncbi:MAG: GDSL-type esterase/lipase family protein [Bacteroidales bacterium]|nr:GDSL-type esterase/lipase family protein [Bacteroidales bacterium]MDD3430719.1 GDSL-type esterase/lipase family protein [Bacteroidales bacterium]MDD4430917.1 GDSL-type esterase/lipase family protein [Bacteroidales bacterium]